MQRRVYHFVDLVALDRFEDLSVCETLMQLRR